MSLILNYLSSVVKSFKLFLLKLKPSENKRLVKVNWTDDWWPDRKNWPKAEGDWLLFTDNALALLMLEEIVIPLRSKSDIGDKTIGLYVICNDVFYWGCADNEEIPPISYGDDLDAPFWDLYEKVRLNGDLGAIEWCCLRRKMRPQKPMIKILKDAGRWTKELEALPGRDQ